MSGRITTWRGARPAPISTSWIGPTPMWCDGTGRCAADEPAPRGSAEWRDHSRRAAIEPVACWHISCDLQAVRPCGSLTLNPEKVSGPCRLQGTASARGWLAGDAGLVLARAVRFQTDFTSDVESLVVSTNGAVRSAGVVPDAFLSTTRLDPQRSVLFVARIEEGAHNLYEMSLLTGRVRRVTDNGLPGVTFSGIEPLRGGALIGVRHERTSDIWLLDATSSTPDRRLAARSLTRANVSRARVEALGDRSVASRPGRIACWPRKGVCAMAREIHLRGCEADWRSFDPICSSSRRNQPNWPCRMGRGRAFQAFVSEIRECLRKLDILKGTCTASVQASDCSDGYERCSDGVCRAWCS